MSRYTRWLLHKMRHWDRSSAAGVDGFVANSGYIAERIEKVWRRPATVIHPPVDVERFTLGEARKGHYLIAARMVPYKRVELVVEAFRAMPGRQLVVCGDGPGAALVREAAAGAPNIMLRGRVPQAELVRLTRTARAFVYAAEEDFGIGMVEAQACGTPLIAYGRGGSRDIVLPETGILFPEQSTADHRGGRTLRGAVARKTGRLPDECAALLRRRLPRAVPHACRGAARGARGGMKCSLIVATRGRDRELDALFAWRRRATPVSRSSSSTRIPMIGWRPSWQPGAIAWPCAGNGPRGRMPTMRATSGCAMRAARSWALPDEDCVFPAGVLEGVVRLCRGCVAGDADRAGRLARGRAGLGELASGERGDHIGNVWTSVIEFNLFLRRAAALALGGFDERLGPGTRSGRPRATIWCVAPSAPGCTRDTIRRSASSIRTSGCRPSRWSGPSAMGEAGLRAAAERGAGLGVGCAFLVRPVRRSRGQRCCAGRMHEAAYYSMRWPCASPAAKAA